MIEEIIENERVPTLSTKGIGMYLNHKLGEVLVYCGNEIERYKPSVGYVMNQYRKVA